MDPTPPVRRRRRLWMVVAALILVASVAGTSFFYLRMPPLAARLLPESEGVVYVDFAPLRVVTRFGETPIIPDPDYQDFVRRTGFQFERDLDQAAVAVHAPEANGERRYSEVFIGRYDGEHVAAYLRKLASAIESYRDTNIFIIPHEGRTVRVALLDDHTVVASNTADIATVRSMIDHFSQSLIPNRGPNLVLSQYKHVPIGSSAWAILDLKAPDGKSSSLPLPGGVNFALPANTITVASLRYTGSVELEVQAFTDLESEAKQLAESGNTFLQLFRAIQGNVQPQGADPDVKGFFASIRIEQEEKRVVLKAEASPTFLKKLFSEQIAPSAAK